MRVYTSPPTLTLGLHWPQLQQPNHGSRRGSNLRRVDFHLDLGGNGGLDGQLLAVDVERVPDEIQLLR